MARKEALRELQSRLAARLQSARTEQRGAAWLAVECAGQGLLFPLRDAGEIFAMSPLTAVPHAHRWFLGVANLRGHLHGVVDLGGFLGLKPDGAGREQSRLVGFNASLDINCTLMVDRLAGLRGDDQLTPEPHDDVPRPAFAGARYRDGGGRLWQALNLAQLAANGAFLQIIG